VVSCCTIFSWMLSFVAEICEFLATFDAVDFSVVLACCCCCCCLYSFMVAVWILVDWAEMRDTYLLLVSYHNLKISSEKIEKNS